MKNYFFWKIGLLLLIFPIFSSAQYQRIGFRAGESIVIKASEGVATLPSYCLDLLYKSPDYIPESYNKLPPRGAISVYISKSKVPIDLHDALKRKLIRYNIDDYTGISFTTPIIAKYDVRIKSNKTSWFDTEENSRWVLKEPDTHFLTAKQDQLATTLIKRKEVFDDPIISFDDDENWMRGDPKEIKRQKAQRNRQDVIWLQSNLERVQIELKKIGQYDKAIDGNLDNTKVAVEKFNQNFNLTGHLWGEDQEETLEAAKDLLLDLENPKKNILLTTTADPLEKIVLPILNTTFFVDKDDVYAYTVRKNGGSVKVNGRRLIDQTIISQCEKYQTMKFGKSSSASNLLWVGSVDPSNHISIFYAGKTYDIILGTDDIYNDLLSKITNLVNSSGNRDVILVNGTFENVGWGNGDFEDKFISNTSGNKFVNNARLFHDLQTNDESLNLAMGKDPDGDADRVSRLKQDTAILRPIALFNADVLGAFMPSNTMMKQLKDEGLDNSVYTYDYKLPSQVNTLILEGDNQSSWRYREFLGNLGYQGLLDNKIILSSACHLKDDLQSYSELIEKYNIKLFIHFSDKVNPSAVNSVFQHLGMKLQQSKVSEIQNVWKKAVDDALSGESQSGLKDEIKKLKNPIFQFSEVQSFQIYPNCNGTTINFRKIFPG